MGKVQSLRDFHWMTQRRISRQTQPRRELRCGQRQTYTTPGYVSKDFLLPLPRAPKGAWPAPQQMYYSKGRGPAEVPWCCSVWWGGDRRSRNRSGLENKWILAERY